MSENCDYKVERIGLFEYEIYHTETTWDKADTITVSPEEIYKALKAKEREVVIGDASYTNAGYKFDPHGDPCTVPNGVYKIVLRRVKDD